MPVHKVTLVPGGVRVYTDATTYFEGKASDFPGNRAAKAAALKAALQDWLDVRQPIADLPSDDPDKTTDPARPDLSWDGVDLVGRAVRVVHHAWRSVSSNRLGGCHVWAGGQRRDATHHPRKLGPGALRVPKFHCLGPALGRRLAPFIHFDR